ncbi:uncharacterized protein LOC111711180 [Eurytemora carolleeae]|uniref:uncharacterized protein LOC111711180 n=1 Tax=Eurytemora carolleeae TaxID=1294199 RepID=UPI000C78996F|nr:uncharacterized protein LOC111711180 [Eurytemora carolleeae]|eukprot:XP_023341228.1 uncharacterized protein LOC111711180 [Eurytemora affinis]
MKASESKRNNTIFIFFNFSEKMLRLLAFFTVVGLGSSLRDDSCRDYLYSECKMPVPVSEVHALTIEECKATCDVFASFNQCSFFSFNNPAAVDENCKIFADETIEEFLAGCNLRGQPLKDSLGNCFYNGATCPGSCVNCNPCTNNPCKGYLEIDCQNVGNGNPEESQNNLPEEGCRQFCFNLMNSSKLTFLTFLKEEEVCNCFQSGERNCKTQILTFDTDITCVP